MSSRSLSRAHQRRVAKAARRAGLAAAGATALFAPLAQASTHEVNSLLDHPANLCDDECTLRDALSDATFSADDDIITFKPGLTGTLTLTQGELSFSALTKLTVTGAGASVKITGDADGDQQRDAGDSRVFSLTSNGAVTISDLSLTGITPTASGDGGAIFSAAPLTLRNTVVSGSLADEGAGVYVDNVLIVEGGMFTNNKAEGLGGAIAWSGDEDATITDSTFAGNSAPSAGAVGLSAPGTDGSNELIVDDSEFTANSSSAGFGGAIQSGLPLTLRHSTLSGNSASEGGGAVSMFGKYGEIALSDSTVTGNTADYAGGILAENAGAKVINSVIVRSTISGNHATGETFNGGGGGLMIQGTSATHTWNVADSTISGNDAHATASGGGLDITDESLDGPITISNSTIAGNSAGTGGGISTGHSSGDVEFGALGALNIDNSTIAANTAAVKGGGIYIAKPEETTAKISLLSSIVGDNTAAGAAADLDRDDSAAAGLGVTASFSLVEAAGDASVTTGSGANVLGVDGRLGALAANGGPTQTILPTAGSPAIDTGHAAPSQSADQRGQARTVDSEAAPNGAGSDATDIGAVETPNVLKPVVVTNNPPPPPPTPVFATTLYGKPVSAGTPLFVAGTSTVSCGLTFGTVSECRVEIRSTKSIKVRGKGKKKVTLKKGTLLATGVATGNAAIVGSSAKVTSDGRKALASARLGLVGAVTVTSTTTAGTKTAAGAVRLLAAAKLTLTSTAQQRSAGGYLKGLSKTVRCTARTKRKADAACKTLKKAGASGSLKSVVKRATPAAQVVVTFTL